MDSSTYTILDGVLTISTGVVDVSDNAFSANTDISSVFIPNTVNRIGVSAFSGCTGLTEIVYESNTSLHEIADGAFNGCIGLVSFVIPNTVSTIGTGVFTGCDGLVELTKPYTLVIGDLPVTIANITLTDYFTLVDGVLTINNVSSIPVNAFDGRMDISSVVIPSTITMIDAGAFNGCENLLQVTFLETPTITDISSNAFSGCIALTSFVIPPSVTTIGVDVFTGCTSLTSLTKSYYLVISDLPSSVVSLTLTDYFTLIDGVLTINSDVTEIPANAFAFNTTIGSAVIPASVTSIGEYAFFQCQTLTYVSILGSAVTIGTNAFLECISLIRITVPFGSVVTGLPTNIQIVRLGSFFNITDGVLTVNNGVTDISDNAFTGFSDVSSVFLHETVTRIGVEAFIGCTGLTQINIPSYVVTIDDGAFNGCTALTGIVIPPSVVTIGTNVFTGCTSLASLTKSYYLVISDLPSSVVSITLTGYFTLVDGLLTINSDITEIQANAFSGNTAITNLIIPSSVTSIGTDAFLGCTSLVGITVPFGSIVTGLPAGIPVTQLGSYFNISLGVLTIDSGVTDISANAFLNNLDISSVIIPSSVVSIGSSAFSGCTALTGIVIPPSVVTIGTNVFTGCTSLTSLTKSYYLVISDLPSSVVSITLTGYFTLVESGVLTINSDVTEIPANAFSGNTAITNLIIPSSVTSIGADAFLGCTNLVGITVPFSSTVTGLPVGIPVIQLGSYFNISLGVLTIDSGVTDIPVNAFLNNVDISSVIIPSSVVSISSSAFAGCSALTGIVIPSSVVTIGTDVFTGCTSLTSLTKSYYLVITDLPSSIVVTLTGYFSDISGVYTINSDVTEIPANAFSGNTAITNLIIPSSVTSIGADAFLGCTNLVGITAPYGSTLTGLPVGIPVIQLGSYFNISLGVLTIDSGVTDISANAFENNVDISSVIIPSSVVSIGSSAFAGCTELTGIVIPPSVVTIGTDVFTGCTSLTSLTKSYYLVIADLPSSVVSITLTGYFTLVDGLLTINSDVTEIPANAFSGNTAITNLIIPSSVTSIGADAFLGCTNLVGITAPYGSTVTGLPVGIPVIQLGSYFNISLGVLTINSGVTDISANAFFGNLDISSVIIPTSVVSIGSEAFSGCTSLTGIVIPPSVTFVGTNVFYNCTSLVSLTKSYYLVITELNSIIVVTLTGYFTLVNGRLTINSDVTDIPANAFSGNTSITHLNIPSSVTSIGTDAFLGCTNLVEISLPYGSTVTGLPSGIPITQIGSNFNISHGVLSINSGVISILDNAFSENLDISSVLVPSSVIVIGVNAFNACTTLTRVTIFSTYVIIEANAFTGCSALAGITVPYLSTITGLPNGVAITYAGAPTPPTPATRTICFKDDTLILCLSETGEEKYIPVQTIIPGTLVKTSLDGFIKVDNIGTKVIENPGDAERTKDRLYVCTHEKYPEVFEDLYITGCHSILVDELSEDEREKTKEILGKIYVTDRKYRLAACIDERAKPYEKEGSFNIWHLALENESYYGNYGIYANGLLVETCSKRMLKEISGMKTAV